MEEAIEVAEEPGDGTAAEVDANHAPSTDASNGALYRLDPVE